MTSHVEFAHYDDYFKQVEVRYVVTHAGLVQNKRTDFFDTEPKGDWRTINFHPDEAPLYSEFLNTMVHRTVEVARKMNIIELDSLMEYGQNNTKLQCELMANICVLDPTFDPPVINVSCRWQRELVYDIVSTHFRVVISTCKNRVNLIHLFMILRTLSLIKSK